MFSAIESFILKNLMVIIAVVILSITATAIYLKLQNNTLELKLLQCESKNAAKTAEAQKVADKISQEYETKEILRDEHFKVVEKEFHTIVEKTPEVHLIDCTSDDALQLLNKVYAARDSSKPTDTATSTSTASK